LAYWGGSWQDVNDLSYDLDFEPPTISSGCQVKALVGPQLDLLIYGYPGPYGYVNGYLQLDADLTATPWWTLYAGLEADVGVEIDVLSDVVGAYSDRVLEEQWLLAQADEPAAEAEAPLDALTNETPSPPLEQAYNATSYGEVQYSSLEEYGQEILTFEGQSGDVIDISVTAENEQLDTEVTLQNAEGEQLTYDDDGGETTNSLILGYELPYSGAYLMVVGSYSGSGGYTLLVDLASTADAQPEDTPEPEVSDIYYGETASGYLEDGDIDIWRFEGQSGDVVTITLASTDEAFDPYLALAEGDPDNTYASNDDADIAGHWDYDAQIAEYDLPYDGTYYILAGSGGGAGDYELSLALAPDEEGSTQTKGIFTVSILPPDPGEWEDYQVRVDTQPPQVGVTIEIFISGSDGFDVSYSGTTGEDGSVIFPAEDDKVPGAESGVTETITVEAEELDQEETFTFIFD
jgi:hypothetical protein